LTMKAVFDIDQIFYAPSKIVVMYFFLHWSFVHIRIAEVNQLFSRWCKVREANGCLGNWGSFAPFFYPFGMNAILLPER
jgi:hypothetical protein